VGIVFRCGSCREYDAYGHPFQEVVGAIDDRAHDLVLPVAQTCGGVVPIYRELPNERLRFPEKIFFGFQIEKTVNLTFVKMMEAKIGRIFVDIH
jgi:hypothetical protein